MLADDSGKAVAKLIRHNFMGIALGFISNTQFGSGFNGGETAFGHLHVRLFLDSRKALGISGAVVFFSTLSLRLQCCFTKLFFKSKMAMRPG